MSLNVNGSFVDKMECENGLKQCVQMYDFIFISETWTNKHSNVSLDGYKPYCKHRKRKKGAKRDSGGLVVYIREDKIGGVEQVGWDFEDGMCFKLDKLFFGWSEDIYLLCVYMRSAKSTRESMNVDLDCYQVLEDQLAYLKGKGVLLLWVI